ncbi:hypothetical protein ODU25_06395, partial [Streptococcus suis]
VFRRRWRETAYSRCTSHPFSRVVMTDKYRRDKRYYEILQKEFFRREDLLVYDQEDYEEL